MSAGFSSYEEMADEADRYSAELRTWLEDHGPGSKRPWPEHTVSNKMRRLAWAEKISELCRRAAEKRSAA